MTKPTPHTKRLFFTKPLEYSEAALYLKNFPDDLRPVFGNNLGGTITGKKFGDLMPAGFSGIMAWFCLNTDEPTTPKVFLAFQCMQHFTYPATPEEVALLEPTGKLLVSSLPFKKDIASISNYQQFLDTHSIPPPTSDGELEASEVKRFNENYMSSPLIQKYQKYGHGYFENNSQFISEFMDQADVKHVRYYFGFHEDTETNKIRIMIAPVDKNGLNITKKTNGQAATFVQKSVPPPPK